MDAFLVPKAAAAAPKENKEMVAPKVVVAPAAVAVSASASPEKGAAGSAEALMQQLRDLVAAAEPAQGEALVAELKALATACGSVVAEKRRAASAADFGETRFKAEASCVQPRGKLSLRLGGSSLCAVDAKKGEAKFEVAFADCRVVLVVPPVEASKPGAAGTLVLGAVPRPAARAPGGDGPTTREMVDAYKKASLAVALADKAAKEPLDGARVAAAFPGLGVLGGATVGDALPQVLARACGVAAEPVLRGAPGAGTTYLASPASRAPYVRANLGSSQGHLHLTKHGLFFHKSPCLFLPVAMIAAISCGRAGAANCSSFDLVVEMEDPFATAPAADDDAAAAKKPPTFEFANVNKDELPEVQRFIADVVLEARAKALKAGDRAPSDDAHADAAAAAAAADDDDDDDDDDEDFDPDARASDSDDDDSDDDAPGDAASPDETDSDANDGATANEADGDDDDGDFDSEDSDDSEDDASDDGLKPGGLEDPEIEAPKHKKRRCADA